MSGHRKGSICERLVQQDEEFDTSSLSDDEADRLLRQLEVTQARAIANIYRFWPRERQYAFDRESGLVACLLVRQFLATLAGGYERLTSEELAAVVRVHRWQLRSHQVELFKLRVTFYGGTTAGSAQ